MDVGLFLMPCHPPEQALERSNRWNVDVLELADRLGARPERLDVVAAGPVIATHGGPGAIGTFSVQDG